LITTTEKPPIRVFTRQERPRVRREQTSLPAGKLLLYTLGILAALAVMFSLAAYLIGASLPADHAFSRSLIISKPPEAVWAVISDFAAQPSWRPQLRSMDRLPDQDGLEAWRVTGSNGESMTMLVVESVPSRRLVNLYRNTQASGDTSWIFEIQPVAQDSQVTLTERVRVEQPLSRFFLRYVSRSRSANQYLAALAKKFGDPAVIQ
jgi:uncharacterized protein YndB with AHSA1/START domain